MKDNEGERVHLYMTHKEHKELLGNCYVLLEMDGVHFLKIH
jgi:hypothetical protein